MLNKIFAILDKITKKLIDFTRYIGSYGKAVSDGYKTNALAPLIWFNVFIDPVFIITACIIKNNVIMYGLMGIVAVLVLFTMIMYLVLFLKNPKLLQSEKYRIEDRKLDIIAEKGGPVLVNPVDLVTKQIGGGLDNE